MCGGQMGALQSCPRDPRSWHSVRVPACSGAEDDAGVCQICQAWRTHGHHSYLCAALQVLLRSSEGQLPKSPLQEQEQESNLNSAREKGVIILPVITTQLCCNHSNKPKVDK